MFYLKGLFFTLSDRIAGLRQEVARAKEREFPDSSPIEVLNALERVLDAIETSVERDFSKNPDTPDRQEKYATAVKAYLTLLECFHDAIGVVANGVKSKVPWAVTRVIEELLRRTKKIDAQVIYAPIWELNFSIHQHRLLKVFSQAVSILNLPEEKKAQLGVPPRVVAINFSYLDRDNPLLYGVLAHEIGHLFSTDYYLSNESIDKTWLDVNVDPIINELPIERRKAFGTEYSALFMKARKRAIEEVGADLFGVLSAGPAFVFSLFDLLSRFSFDLLPMTRNNFYPSNRLRIRTALEVLRSSWDYSTEKSENENRLALKRAVLGLDAIAKQEPCLEDERGADPVLMAYRYFFEVDFPLMKKEVASWVTKPFDFSDFFSRSDQLLKRLDNQIPPNQYEKTLDSWADPVAILNVAWLAELKATGDANWQKVLERTTMDEFRLRDRLVVKAIELSEIQRAYQS